MGVFANDESIVKKNVLPLGHLRFAELNVMTISGDKLGLCCTAAERYMVFGTFCTLLT